MGAQYVPIFQNKFIVSKIHSVESSAITRLAYKQHLVKKNISGNLEKECQLPKKNICFYIMDRFFLSVM